MNRRRGFAMIMAISLLALVAMMLGALAVTCHSDAQRTMAATADAQLRQLLLAGAEMAPHWLEGKSAKAEIPVPEMLRNNDATLELYLDHVGSGQVEVQLAASFKGRHMREGARFLRREGRWRLVSAQLSDF